jgi:hypothetical protein
LLNLFEVAREIARWLASIFLRGADNRRPTFDGIVRFRTDPYWRDCMLFYEYFHGDDGAGIGAGHHTGWAGTIANLMHFFAVATADSLLDGGFGAAVRGIGGAHDDCAD